MAFAKSAEVDPAFDQGLVELSKAALEQRINIKLDLALAAMRTADSTPAGAMPMVQLYRGRVERLAGEIRAQASLRGQYASAGTSERVPTKFPTGFLQRPGMPALTSGAQARVPR